MTYQVSYQDFRGWRETEPDKMPEVFSEIYEDKETAEIRRDLLKSQGLTVCVTELAPLWPVTQHKGPTPIDGDGPRFNEKWKMAR